MCMTFLSDFFVRLLFLCFLYAHSSSSWPGLAYAVAAFGVLLHQRAEADDGGNGEKQTKKKNSCNLNK